MLGQIHPTAYDLRFSVFGIPVRVHPAFWLIAAMLGWNSDHFEYMLAWVACLFVSILIHELGHAFTARYFGWPPEIILYHFGGLAVFMPTRGYTAARSILISFMGPGAGFLLFGLVIGFEYWLQSAGRAVSPLTAYSIMQLKWINLAWGLVNLMPIIPLDGGQICRDICTSIVGRPGHRLALKIGIAASAGMAYFFFTRGGNSLNYPAILFVVLGIQNFQMHQEYR